MEIADSARNHGISEVDIALAVRHELRTIFQDDRLLIIGPARDAQLLEIVVLDPDGEPVVIHAMALAGVSWLAR